MLDRFLTLLFIASAASAMLWLSCAREEAPEPPLPADTGSTDAAIVELFEEKAAAVRRSPGDPRTWQRLGAAYHAHGRLELAIECYERGLELAAKDTRIRYFLALAQERLGRLDDATTNLRRVTVLDPTYAPAHWRLGLWLLDGGDLEGARSSVDRARVLAPADRAAILAMARVQLQASRPAAAAELIEKHLAVSQLTDQPPDGYAHFLLSRAYGQMGCDAEARRELALGRGSEPQGIEAQWSDPWSDQIAAERTGFRAELDDAIVLLGPEPQRAVAAFERLRVQEPGNVGLLINLGIGYRRLGRLEDSASTLREAVRLQPARPLAHLHLAVTYGGMSRDDGPRADEAPGSKAPLVERALSHANRTIELRPTSAKGHAVRADLLASTGRIDEAVSSFRRAADLDPDDLQWHYQAASLLCRQGRWGDAIPLLESTLEKADGSVDALFLLGASQANIGRLDDAAATLERARSLAPQDTRVRQALKQLRRARTADAGR